MIAVIISSNLLAKKLMPPPVPQVLPLATAIAELVTPTPAPSHTPEPILSAAQNFYLRLKNKQFTGASLWFGQQLLISDQSIAQAVNETQFLIKEIDVSEANEEGIGLRLVSANSFLLETAATLTTKGKLTSQGVWAFQPIGPVKVVAGTQPTKFSGIQKKAENRVTGSLSVKKVILGYLPQSSRESIFGAWVLWDGAFAGKVPIKRVHFEEGEHFYAADPYFEKKKSESGESGEVWDFIVLDPIQIVQAKTLTFTITNLFSSAEFVLGATPTEIDTSFKIEVPLL